MVKMRHAVDRVHEAELERERALAVVVRRLWLDSLTPAHRAKHVGPAAWGACSECLSKGLANATRFVPFPKEGLR